MKTILRYMLILPLFAVSSCLREPFEKNEPCPCEDEKNITLKLSIPYAAPRPVTRSIDAPQENAIETLDILAFKVVGGVETFQYWTYAQKDAGNIEGASFQQFNTKLLVKDFSQRFVLISNARSKIQTLIASRPDGWVGQEKEDMLKNLIVDLSESGLRWKTIDATNYTAIPMWGETAPKIISVTTTSISDNPIPMLRMVAKVDVQLDESVKGLTDIFKLKSVHLYYLSPTGRIVPKPGQEYIGEDMVAKKASLPVPNYTLAALVSFNDFSSPGIPDVAMRGAIYLLESAAKNSHIEGDQETHIVVGGIYGSDTQETYYRLDFYASDGKTHIDVLRNHKYTFNITAVHGRGYSSVGEAYISKQFNMSANLLTWDEGQIRYIHYDNHYMLGVSHEHIELSGKAHILTCIDNVIKVATDYPSGWTAAAYDDLACTIPSTWLTLYIYKEIQPNQMQLLMDVNTVAPRTGYVLFKAGRITCVLKVTQFLNLDHITGGGNIIPGKGGSYIGAFWRAEQTGERIIRITGLTGANAGPWTATVEWYDGRWNPYEYDGIVLAAGGSADPNVSYTSSSMTPGDAENYQVKGSATITGTAAGTGTILFRIGLQRKASQSVKWAYEPHNPNYTTTFPARYAVVLIHYGANKSMVQKIFLRQGEGADYLMRNSDAGAGDLNSSSRPNAVKFTPYNLTAETLNSQVAFNGIGLNPGKFTDYPTQSGAFFQWANATNIRWAWDPMTASAPTNWNTTTGLSGFWTGAGNHSATHESCPAGYRRPNDGITNNYANGNASGSEFRESLWLNPRNGNGINNLDNSVWGYYADGFFDRRQIVNGVGTTVGTDSSVSTGDANIAHKGRLFFNPNTNASLFFPATGIRSISFPGQLEFVGYFGSYWSSSTYTSRWNLSVSPNSTSMGYENEIVGYSIRCVCK